MPKKESWNTRLGVILAVSGSAVGLGNFLRFPGQVAQYGGGAFMIAYFIAFLIIGLPICWAEWTMGRKGGQLGFNSSPGILNAIIHHPIGKYVGVLGVTIPLIIYMYYVYIESWCLGYSVNFIRGAMTFDSIQQSGDFWATFIGKAQDGSAIGWQIDQVGFYLITCFILNFFLIYRGIAKGIELFCLYAMPALLAIAVIILVRVLTLGAPNPELPEQNINNGLGYLWNPHKLILQELTSPENTEATSVAIELEEGISKVSEGSNDATWEDVTELVGPTMISEAEAKVKAHPESMRIIEHGVIDQLLNPQLWLAAAGQIFFSLSVGFGVIITYASYLKKDDDIVLSGLSATSANEFCEVGLGGLISIPAAYAFLGVAGVAGMGTFGLGFNVLPMVFSSMPMGSFFGFLFFFLLFLAAVTSSLSMLQPVIAFLEESIGINRKMSVSLLGLITAVGCMFVVYFSADVKALDTLDFWAANVLIFVLATIQIIVFGWIVGIEQGWEDAHVGASIRIPNFFKFIMKYITPVFLITIFILFILIKVFGWNPGGGESEISYYVTDLIGDSNRGIEHNKVAILSVSLIVMLIIFFSLITAISPSYKAHQKNQNKEKEAAQ